VTRSRNGRLGSRQPLSTDGRPIRQDRSQCPPQRLWERSPPPRPGSPRWATLPVRFETRPGGTSSASSVLGDPTPGEPGARARSLRQGPARPAGERCTRDPARSCDFDPQPRGGQRDAVFAAGKGRGSGRKALGTGRISQVGAPRFELGTSSSPRLFQWSGGVCRRVAGSGRRAGLSCLPRKPCVLVNRPAKGQHGVPAAST